MNRFLVTWRSRVTQRTHPVGVLTAAPEDYRFEYLSDVGQIEDFRAFVNFPDLSREYRSNRLFPFFSQRVMDPRRSDYKAYIAALGLAENASQVDVLGRASGARKGDTVQVILEPRIAPDGGVDHTFLLSGVRHAPGNAPAAIDQLTSGARLTIREQPENRVNPQALLVCTTEDQVLGWVPDALLDFVHQVVSGHYQLTASRVNGSEWPSQLRVVVNLKGNVPTDFEPLEPLAPLARA